MPRVYIGIGSDLGRRVQNIERGLAMLKGSGFRIVRCSRIYETKPWNMTDHRKFLNLVVAADTVHLPAATLEHLRLIEHALGRTRHRRNEPRTLDLDLLFYANRIVHQAGLSIPHPRLHRRAFVLRPLADIAPNKLHPVQRRRIFTLLKNVDPSGVRRWR